MRHRVVTRSLAAIVAPALVACGGDDLGVSPYTVDTRGTAGAAGAAAVAFDDGDGWRAAEQSEPGVFRFAPAQASIGIAIVCRDSDAPTVVVEHAIASLKRDLARPCAVDVGAAAGIVRLVPAGAQLAVGPQTYSNGSELEPAERTIAGSGPADVVAFTDAQMAIRRGVVLPLAEPLVIDVAGEGAPLEPITSTVSVDAGETAALAYTLITANGTHATLRGGDGSGSLSVATAPRSLLIAGDRHRLEVSAWRDDTYRSAAVTAAVGAAVAPLPALPVPMTAASARWDDGQLAIDWQGGLAGEVRLRISQDALTYVVSASPAWLAETGADGWRSPDLAAVEGWKPAWRLDPQVATARWAVSSHAEAAVDEVESALESSRSGVLAVAAR